MLNVVCVLAESLQLCLALCSLIDYSLRGSSVNGIFQARMLVWVAISFSRGSSWPLDQKCISCLAGEFFTTEPPGKNKGEVKEEEVFIKWQSWKCQQTDPQKLTKKKWTLTQWHTRDSKHGNLVVGIIQWKRNLTLVIPVTVFCFLFFLCAVSGIMGWHLSPSYA